MANTITRKALSLALIANADVDALATELAATPEDVTAAIESMTKALTRKRVSKPSAETLANRKLAEDVAAEVIARGVEVTAKDVAEYATDAEGMPMSTRKVGALLKNAAGMGLIEKSPEKWPVAHYAPCGFAFAPKPERKTRKKSEDTPEVSED